MIDPRKELGPLLKLCRKFGVTELTLEGVSIKFGEMPRKLPSDSDEGDEPETDELTAEQLLYFSVGGAPP